MRGQDREMDSVYKDLVERRAFKSLSNSMTVAKHPEVEVEVKVDSTRALVNHWRIFRVVGVNPPDEATWWGRHYRIYSVLYNCIFHISLSVSLQTNLLLSNSLETFCESLCVAMPQTLYILKMLNVLRMRRQLLNSLNVFRSLDGRLSSVQERSIVAEGVAKAEFMFLQIARGCVITAATGILYIIMSSERTLMYPSWIPWNWQTGSASVFVASAAGHTILIIMTSILVTSLSTLPCTYFILLSAHTKALAWRVGRLGYESRHTRDEVQQLLIGYIRDHQTIVHLFKLLERSLSMICFLQFFCTACAQCAISYFIIFGRVGIMRIANMLALLVVITTETLMLCYTAELVAQEGDNLLAAIYSCNWLDQSVHFRRLLVLMMVRCQEPLTFVAGVLVPVSMKTFQAVCKGAYTLLTVLNEMRETDLDY